MAHTRKNVIPGSQNHGSAREVLWAFLRLGCVSFGGPVAHFGYFHAEFVSRRGWCTEEEYAGTVALAQSLPGPASSQVAFALGLYRAGNAGGLAAWVGFTMPSALLIFAFACGHSVFTGKVGAGVLHGLQLVAVAMVAQAVVTMRRSLAPDFFRTALAAVAALVTLFLPSAFTTVGIIALSALFAILLPHGERPAPREDRVRARPAASRRGVIAGALFVLLLVTSPLVAKVTEWRPLSVFDAFYRTGALVFGGGHVVLPLLERAVVTPGWIDERSFLAGYGAAQAVPGPLFTFAAYLGAVLRDPATGAAPAGLMARAGMSSLALVAIFLPGLLLMLAVLPAWARLGGNARFQGALRLVNASVVGVLFAALVRPVTTTAVHSWTDAATVAAALIALALFKSPPWTVVLALVVWSALLSG